MSDDPDFFTEDMCFDYFEKIILNGGTCRDGQNRTTLPTPIGYDVEDYKFRVQIMVVHPDVSKPYKPSKGPSDEELYPWK
jgi:hypothetical protein